MSNRQARREQSKQRSTARTQRPQAAKSPRPSGGGGGGSNLLSQPFMLIAGALIVVLAVLLGIFMVMGSDDGSDELVALLEKSEANLPVDMVNGNKLGSDDAPVKITMYEDFQCPFCLKFTAEQEGEIIEQFVKTGRVQLEYQHFPILGTESVKAALASQCAADQGKFWQYHNRLFVEQAKAGQVEDEKLNVGRYTDDKLKSFASELGLDSAKFNACLDSGEHLDAVTDQQRVARQFGITGTPGFIVNGQPLGAGTPSDIDAWRQLVENVENALATATAEASASPSASATAETTPSPAASPTAAATKAP